MSENPNVASAGPWSAFTTMCVHRGTTPSGVGVTLDGSEILGCEFVHGYSDVPFRTDEIMTEAEHHAACWNGQG